MDSAQADLEKLGQRQRSRLTTKEAARLMGISDDTVLRMIKLGQLEGRKLGKRWRISRESVRCMLEDGTEE